MVLNTKIMIIIPSFAHIYPIINNKDTSGYYRQISYPANFHASIRKCTPRAISAPPPWRTQKMITQSSVVSTRQNYKHYFTCIMSMMSRNFATECTVLQLWPDIHVLVWRHATHLRKNQPFQELSAVWACLGVYPLDMPRTPYRASEGKRSQ